MEDWEKELEGLKDVVVEANEEDLDSWEQDLDEILAST